MSAKPPSRLPFWNVFLGNLFEHYETALFGFLSPFLAPLMFPAKDPLTALMWTYAMIPLAMMARPIGSLVFGRIGDLQGRGRALFLTLLGMAVVSGGIALSPTYSQVGMLAPFLFCLGRALQNFFAAGETVGGAIALLEGAPEKRQDLYISFYNASTMGGHLLASLGVFLLCQYQMMDPGWRLLYLGGCLTALFGCKMRRSLPPTQRSPSSFINLKEVLWTHRKPLLWIAICSGFSFACYSMALVLVNGLLPLISPLTKAEVMQMNTYLVLFDFCALPFFGWVASKISREKLMLWASLGVALLSIPLFSALAGASMPMVIAVRLILVLFGVAFCAPFQAWARSLVPPESCGVILSLGYALGSQLLGGPTAVFALWCFQKTEAVSSIGWYWAALGWMSSAIVFLSRRRLNRKSVITTIEGERAYLSFLNK